MDKIASSELIINSDGSIFHLHIMPEELADNVILVGDPGRVDIVASHFDKREFRRASREFVTVTGEYKGKRITALSTGIGTDNIDIVINELDALANIDFKSREIKEKRRRLKILRIGTSGAIEPDLALGSHLFSQYSIGCDGLLNWYAGGEKIRESEIERAFIEQVNYLPTLASPYIVKSSSKLAEQFKDFSIMGVTISAPGFYAPQGRVLRLPLAMPQMVERFESFRFRELKISNFEMESSAIAALAKLLGHEAGTVCTIIANRHIKESEPNYARFIEELIVKSLEKI